MISVGVLVISVGILMIPVDILVVPVGILLIAVLLLAAGMLFAWWLSRDMRGAIRHIERGVGRVSRGDLDHRIPVTSNDELGQLASAFNDMVAQRREAGIREERQREFLSAVLENLTEGVVACDEQGNVNLFNRTMREFLGPTPERIPASRWAAHYALYHTDGKTPLNRREVPLMRALDGQQVDHQELIIAPAGRPARHIVASGQPIYANDGRNLGAVVAMHDITERKRAEAELREHARELARSNAELEQFAYVASHDLQEPLRTVSSYTQLLDRRYRNQLDAEANEYFDFITESVRRMRDQITGLLTYARVVRNLSPPRATDLNRLLAAQLANLAQAIDEQQARITHDTLPTLKVFPVELGRVFQNLIANALKFRGPDAPRIHIGCQRKDDAWEITVADNGIGVAAEHAERIFMLYKRLHTRDKYPGDGLGLPLSRRIIEHHGGRIWLTHGDPDSEFCGAIFHFTLPARTPATNA